MRSKAEIFQQHFGLQTWGEANQLFHANPPRWPQLPMSEYTKLTLPYKAPGHLDIPSLEEIDVGMQQSLISSPVGFRPVCRIRDTVVKIDWKMEIIQEAENLLWLRNNTQVRVPELYAAFSRNGDNKPPYYLVLKYIEGQSLNWKLWKSLNDDQHEKIHSKISEQLQLLRSVPSEGYYGRIDNQGFHPDLPLVRTDRKGVCGPYKTHEALLAVMYNAAELAAAFQGHSKYGFENFAPGQWDTLSKLKPILANCNGKEPTLTHCDLSMANIVVSPLDGTMQNASDFTVTFIDWNIFGWYPAYTQRIVLNTGGVDWFDRTTLTCDNEGEKKWQERVAKYFSQSYEEQVALHKQTTEMCSYRLK